MGRPSEQAGQEGKDLPRRHAGHSKPKVTRRIVGLSGPPNIPTRRSPRTLIELRQILNLNGATMMNKAIFLSVILAFLSWACAAPPTPAITPTAGELPEDGLPDLGGRELRIASDPIPPLTIIEDDGSLTGFEPALLDEICGLLNCTSTWEIVSFESIFAQLAAGEYDAILAAIVYTEDRDEVVDFTIPYYLTGVVVSTRVDETGIQSREDLLKPDVFTGVQTGGMTETAALDLGIPDVQIKRYATVDLEFLALDNGDIDAALEAAEVASEFVNDIYADKLKVVTDAEGQLLFLTQESVHAVVRQGDDELREALNAAIKQLILDGTVARLLEEWNITVGIPTPE